MSKYNGQPKDRTVEYEYLVQSIGNAEYLGRFNAADRLSAYMFRQVGEDLPAPARSLRA